MRSACILVISLIWINLYGQPSNRKISLDYAGLPLKEVLKDLSNKYEVRFAYSSDFIPMDYPVRASVQNASLSEALDLIFSGTPVKYAFIGGQVALRAGYKSAEKRPPLTRPAKPLPKSVPQTTPLYQESKSREALVEKRPSITEAPRLSRRELRQLQGEPLNEADIDFKPLPVVETADEGNTGQKRLAQISLLPMLGTNAGASPKVSNHFSVNVFWGTNGGVEGVEVGGLVNSVTKDVAGIQVAGLGNRVGHHLYGIQIGGLFNSVRENVYGIQVGGLFNTTGAATAIQIGGLFNVVSGDFAGVQTAGLFNVSTGAAEGVQVASLFNTSKGKTKTQVASLFNVAGDVDWGQVGLLFNAARKVKGFQIGLINISDSISGMPIGLLNLVRHGYNRVEFAGSEAFYGNFALKLGARSFYNIFQLGLRWDDLSIPQNGAEPKTGKYYSWGLGYGFGTAAGLGRQTTVNLEAVVLHVNERESWTKKLNMLGQARLTLDIRTGKRTSLFAGPVFNIMFSRLTDPETGKPGSILVPYSIWEKDYEEDINARAWVGFTAGIRL